MIERILAFVLGTCIACWIGAASAQGYPSRPVRVIVPTPPGGVIDVTTRAITPRLSELLGHPFIVENRAGADTMIGSEMVARAAPDGYTLLSVFDNFPLSQFLFSKVPYDALKDFAPISLLIRGPMIVAVPQQLGIKDLNRFLELARSKPGALNYASAGAGTSSHLTVELFKLTTGIDVQAVHYKGAGPAVSDLLGGHVQLMIATSGTLLPHARSGRIVPLAVSATGRIPILPDVPAIAESFPGFDAQSWVGMLAPAGTSSAIIRQLNAGIAKVLAEPDIRRLFEDQGFEVLGSSAEVFEKWLATQSEKWGRVIRERKITLGAALDRTQWRQEVAYALAARPVADKLRRSVLPHAISADPTFA